MKKHINASELSMRYLRKRGYLPGVVERWNPHAGPRGIRQDLFGCIDIIAVRVYEAFIAPALYPTLAVQSTTAPQIGAHVRKIEEAKVTIKIRKEERELLVLPLLFLGGWRVQVHGWEKVGGKWKVRIWDMAKNQEVYE